MGKSTTTETTETNCVPGSAGCSCLSGFPAAVTCVRTVTTETTNATPVGVWTVGEAYVSGDVVRVGSKRFKCREWPNFFWCTNTAYRPEMEPNGIWDQAWTADGMCTP